MGGLAGLQAALEERVFSDIFLHSPSSGLDGPDGVIGQVSVCLDQEIGLLDSDLEGDQWIGVGVSSIKSGVPICAELRHVVSRD